MKLTREEMLATLGTRAASNNGRFIIGVLSTGIYCLPSCHARTPKPENVRFFANGGEAEAAGLRPCKKCRPDEWERGEDRDLQRLESLVKKVRSCPQEFANSAELAASLGIGISKLHELSRQHYQATPGEILAAAKLNRACDLLVSTSSGIAEIAFDAGYESLSVFNDNFKKRIGLTPSDYRKLREAERFSVALPAGYDLATFSKSFFRDPESPTERLVGCTGSLATALGTLVSFTLTNPVEVRVAAGNGLDAYRTLNRVMGFSQAPEAFEQIAAQSGFSRLVEGRKGARIPQTFSTFDGLIWAIVGQQINLPFAFKLRKRLFQKFGTEVEDGLFSVPQPDSIARILPQDLMPLQFSQRKAEYLIGVAQKGQKWIEGLEDLSFTSARNELLSTRGLGVWSVNYLLMRALGFPDCLPLGDTGLTSGVAKLHCLEQKPDVKEIETLMLPFAPHRSLATYHLWQSL
jgi:AraC family transcriptional regulator of adaptative response / DNA-3-methyladenine glycosylase II